VAGFFLNLKIGTDHVEVNCTAPFEGGVVMYSKPRELWNFVSRTPEHGDKSISAAVGLMLVGIVRCIFIPGIIPLFLNLNCDYLKQIIDAVGSGV